MNSYKYRGEYVYTAKGRQRPIYLQPECPTATVTPIAFLAGSFLNVTNDDHATVRAGNAQWVRHSLTNDQPLTVRGTVIQLVAASTGDARRDSLSVGSLVVEQHEEAPEAATTAYPAELTVETVAAWIWSNAAMPADMHGILAALVARGAGAPI